MIPFTRQILPAWLCTSLEQSFLQGEGVLSWDEEGGAAWGPWDIWAFLTSGQAWSLASCFINYTFCELLSDFQAFWKFTSIEFSFCQFFHRNSGWTQISPHLIYRNPGTLGTPLPFTLCLLCPSFISSRFSFVFHFTYLSWMPDPISVMI